MSPSWQWARGAFVAVATLLVGPSSAADRRAADGGDSPLVRAVAAYRSATPLDKYAALRGVWRQWDQQDPELVEEIIGDAARDGSVPPSVRAYAAILEGYARRRRGDLEGAKARLRAVGMVDRWITVGPFDNEGKTGLARAYGPEEDLAGRIDPLKAYPGKERPVRWRVAPDVHGFGWLDMGDLMHPRENICGYASTFVRSKSARKTPRPISIWAGATGALRVFWNGAEVLSDSMYRGLDADRIGVAATLAPGVNRLTVKACGTDEAPIFSIRLGDARGGPDADLQYLSDPAAVEPTSAKAAPVRAGRLEGPLTLLQRRALAKGASAEALEAYARYLAGTGGDDPAEHQAVDLARKAADLKLTLPRALLAAQLADDRNEKREWLERAAKLPGAAGSIELMLAQAELARTGPNWRDATPHYDRVLSVEPDNVRAVLGRVELYQEAGLRQTALETLEQALARNPRSVALLRVNAQLLRELGRSREAAEAADRYAAYRFDDSKYMSDRIDLAVLRRDERAAARWIDRLLATTPDSVRGLTLAGDAMRSLGQDARAIGYYHRALDLAPEDVDVLRAEADVHAKAGNRDEQLKLLRQILMLKPQQKDVREYVEHIEPPRPRPDEAYAWDASRFLALRTLPPGGEQTRTLRELTVTTVYTNGLASRFHQIVFQPMTDEAAATAREYAFGYQADSETVQLRAARVYRDSGKIDEAVESGDAPADNPALAMYTSARTFFVHFPRLSARDVVELRYRIEDVAPRNEFADYFGEIVYLQRPEPLLNAEYVLRTPKARSFSFFATPLPGLVRKESLEGDLKIYNFAVAKVPAVFAEPWMPPLPELLAHVHVSTYETWDEVASWYWGLAKDQLIPDSEVRQRVAEITKGMTDPAAKVRAIYGYVVQQTRYVALELGIYGYKPRPCALTFARGWGDCKDKATLIVTMLREAGVPASLVLVRSGLRGEIEPSPPSLAPFDHVVVYVPSMDLYLDGTAEYTGSTELPSLDRGALALVVEEGGKGRLVHLPDPGADQTLRTRRIEATLAPDGTAQVDLRTDAGGALASEARQRYHAKGTRKERVAHDLAEDFPGFELGTGADAVEMNDLEDIEQPIKMRVRGKVPGFGRREGADLSLAVAPTSKLVPALASLSSRNTPVRLRLRSSVRDEIVVHLPAGWRVKTSPEPLEGSTPFGRFRIRTEVTGTKVTVNTLLSLDRSRVGTTDYAAWRAFCEAVDRAFSQRLLIGAAK